jgi:hypothetical protein
VSAFRLNVDLGIPLDNKVAKAARIATMRLKSPATIHTQSAFADTRILAEAAACEKSAQADCAPL